MAARLNPRHTEMVRQKIQAANIIHRLHQCVDGEVELTTQQISAAIALLDRSVPKLQQIQMTGSDDGPVKIEVVRFANGTDSK